MNKNFSPLLNSIQISPNPGLKEALEYIKMGLTEKEITLFAYGCCFILLAATVLVSFAALLLGFQEMTPNVLLAGTLLAILSIFLVKEYPKKLSASERMNAVGYAPQLVAYLIITLKQDPNLEKAVKFTAENGDNRITEDLRKLLWSTWAGKYNSVGEALPYLGEKWGESVKGLRDALYAIRSSQIEKYEHRRLNTLDRALTDLLENIKQKFREFANNLRMPTMLLFTFGVMMPLILIIFIPLVAMMGFEMGSPLYVSLMLLGILVGIFFMSDYVLSKRPMSFSPIKVPADHPGLLTPGRVRFNDKEVSVLQFSFLVFVFVSAFSVPYVMGSQHPLIMQWGTFPLVLGAFAGMWAYFHYSTSERMKIRDMIQRAEEDCIESCFHIGNRLMSGMPPEEAIMHVSESLSVGGRRSYLALILERTVRNIKYMNMGLKAAFFDPERGSLKDVDSGVIHGLLGLFANSMERGVDAAAETLIHSTQHFRDIRKVEDGLRETIAYTTSMTRLSCVMIAPVLCGVAIALTEVFVTFLNVTKEKFQGASIDGITMTMFSDPQLTPDIMTVILGGYLMVLLLLLTRFVTILEHGDDELKIKHEIAKALPQCAIAFTFTLIACRLIFTYYMIPNAISNLA